MKNLLKISQIINKPILFVVMVFVYFFLFGISRLLWMILAPKKEGLSYWKSSPKRQQTLDLTSAY